MDPARAVGRLLRMPSTLMLLTLGLGFALGVTFPGMGLAAMAALAALMTFSLVDIPFRGLEAGLRFVPSTLFLSFLLHPALLLLAAALTAPVLWPGWAILAAVPPAISVIPFAAILGGNVRMAVTSNAVLYLISLVLTPLVALLLLGVDVGPAALVLSVLVLILAPLLLSRGVQALALGGDRVEVLRNLSFAALTFLVGAANREVILARPALAGEALLGALLVVGLASAVAAMLWRRDPATRMTMVLFAGYKNSGLAATLALALLAPAAVVAPTMMIVFQILWIGLLARLRRRPRGPGPTPP